LEEEKRETRDGADESDSMMVDKLKFDATKEAIKG
jgi:hypothetical protein